MALNLAPDAQAALDLAKRTVPEGAELDAGLLMAALLHSAGLQERFSDLVPLLEEPEPHVEEVPEKVGLEESLRGVLGVLRQREEPLDAAAWLQALAESEPGQRFLRTRRAAAGSWRASPEREAAIDALSTFGRMLTVTEPPHRGTARMQDALRSFYKTLLKEKRRNAIVIGPPGTGKSALVYEFARQVVSGDESLPLPLRDLDVFELSPSFLRSGASMVGQYDERVKQLLAALEPYPRIILFVDEVHSLLQSSMHHRGPFSDANETIKAALSKGTISCIGCTTTAEYRHYIEPDGALRRRFGIIKLEEPSRQTTLEILEARLPRLEGHYAPLRVPVEMLARAFELADEYVPSRYQPDKSIQLLDEACAVATLAQAESLTEDALIEALEDMVGRRVVKPERLTEEGVFEQLSRKIVGQDDTLRGIARAFVAGLGEWRKGRGARGRFFFCGPTGVGKTQVALILAEILGGGQPALLRIDCNTLQGSGRDSGPAINRLLGAPPGYVGYVAGQGGLLSKIREMPLCIVLFDELEKADPGVGKVLLQILDDGRVDDNDGNSLDFRRAFVIFTTNAGCTYDVQRGIGFGETADPGSGIPSVDANAVKAELRAIGQGEEFLGRNLDYFLFQGLDANAIRVILDRQLEGLRNTADTRGYTLEWTPEVVPYLTAQWQPRFGVRHLITILRHRITEQLSVAEAQGELAGVRRIRLEVLRLSDTGNLAGAARREREGDTLRLLLT